MKFLLLLLSTKLNLSTIHCTLFGMFHDKWLQTMWHSRHCSMGTYFDQGLTIDALLLRITSLQPEICFVVTCHAQAFSELVAFHLFQLPLSMGDHWVSHLSCIRKRFIINTLRKLSIEELPSLNELDRNSMVSIFLLALETMPRSLLYMAFTVVHPSCGDPSGC